MEKYLTLPLCEEEVRSLRLGDVIWLSGELVQLLSSAHKRALEYKKEGRPLPFEIENMAVYHCYTCLSEKDGKLICHYLGASTSAGVNAYEPAFIRAFNIRAVVGKGGMDGATLEAMREVGCVYLAQIGGCTQFCSRAVVETKEKFWEDLAANLGVKLEFKDLGPLIVAMDANGNSLYDEVGKQVEENKQKVYEKLGVC